MSAAERRARLLAASQKPIGHNQLVALQDAPQQAHAQQAQQARKPRPQHTEDELDQQQQQQYSKEATVPDMGAAAVAAPPAAAPAAVTAAAASHGFAAYTDDMDDMDATLYMDADQDRMKLKSKTEMTAQQLAALQMQQPQPGSGGIKQGTRSLAPGPAVQSVPEMYEDDIETYKQLTPLASHRHLAPPMSEESPSSNRVRPAPPTLDSAAEEMRLDALRGKGQIAATRIGAAGDDSGSEYSQTISREPSPAAPPGGSGWVDPSTRLQQVQVRAASRRHTDALDEGADEEHASAAAAAAATAQAAQDDEAEQSYQRALLAHQQQQQQQQQQQHAAPAPSSSAASDNSTDPQELAYQQQLRLQAELALRTQQRAERGELSQDEQRAAGMRLKRPPLLLPWDTLDMVSFFHSSVPRGGWLHCRLIKRSASGFASFLTPPRYELYTEEMQGSKFLAQARKVGKTKPNYHLTCEPFFKGEENKIIAKDSPLYAGKVTATLTRSDYVVYDAGFNPSKGTAAASPVSPSPISPSPSPTSAASAAGASSPSAAAGSAAAAARSHPREELAHISYKPHLSGKTPRKLAVLLPILLPDSHRDAHIAREFPNQFLSTSLAYAHLWTKLVEAQRTSRVPRAWLCLLNKPPRYHADTGQYVLDFCGRAPQVSVKNFQLVYPEEPDEVLFQLGRLDEENFSVDFRFPISPMQAFAIALSSLDYKWTVD